MLPVKQETEVVKVRCPTCLDFVKQVNRRYLKALSPYVTRHIKRYGDYVVNLQAIPQPLEVAMKLPPEILES
ncbi:MAG: hypothetical protein AAFV71_23105 [Cyanobacteria bacterium J06633_8]